MNGVNGGVYCTRLMTGFSSIEHYKHRVWQRNQWQNYLYYVKREDMLVDRAKLWVWRANRRCGEGVEGKQKTQAKEWAWTRDTVLSKNQGEKMRINTDVCFYTEIVICEAGDKVTCSAVLVKLLKPSGQCGMVSTIWLMKDIVNYLLIKLHFKLPTKLWSPLGQKLFFIFLHIWKAPHVAVVTLQWLTYCDHRAEDKTRGDTEVPITWVTGGGLGLLYKNQTP